jgi:hypothetical protein
VDSAPFDALIRALACGERSRRETLRLLLGAGASATALAALSDVTAKKKHHHKKHKRKKKKIKGDSRCKDRNLLTANGICIDVNDPTQRSLVTCSALQGCVCTTDSKGVRVCIAPGDPLCLTTCASDDDCDPGLICVNIGGCCLGDPGLQRTCGVPCPPL